MQLSIDSNKPIYLKIAEKIEENIITGEVKEEEQIMSTNQIAALYSINPATAAKGINLLVERGIVYKKRGIGMFVSTGALHLIIKQRKRSFFNDYLIPVMNEAKNLNIQKEDIIQSIQNFNQLLMK